MNRKNIIFCISIILIFFTTNSYAKSVEDAIKWAEGQVGSNWDSQCGRVWAWWCMHFCGHAYGRVPSGMNAIDGWKYSDSVFGDRSTDWNAPKGALVFFKATSSNGYWGHVGISDGNGKMYHAWSSGVRKDSISFGGEYLGWRWPDAWTSDEPGSSGSSGKPDLVVREVYLTDKRTSFLPGESFRIYTKVENIGDADADHDIRIKYYLSNGEKIDDNPVKLDDDKIYKEDIKEGKGDDEKTDVNAPMTPGTYNITVLADTEDDVDEEHESNNWYDPPLVFEVAGDLNAKPVGSLDYGNCENIAGWAKDPDTESPINVHFYADGPAGAGGVFIKGVPSNQYSSGIGNYGFNIETPELFKDGNFHYIYAYAIDSDGGENPLIGKVGIVCVQSTPLGDPVYRFWSDEHESHFYTISESEKDSVINNLPVWKYEGIAWYAYPTQEPGTSPVYRFWSSEYESHFYTISESEKNSIINNLPVWKYEGIAWYAYPTQESDTTPIYRFWSSYHRSHFYTISEEEKNLVISTLPVWEYENVAWYLKADHSIKNAITDREFSAYEPSPSPPKCAFTADKLSGKEPFTVSFKDNSDENVISRVWDFGDNSTSTDTNPVHTFNSDGIYSVTLTVRGEDGWQTLTKENYITVEPLRLQDALSALQVLVGMNPDGISLNNNEKIGLERVIYILQNVAELRE